MSYLYLEASKRVHDKPSKTAKSGLVAPVVDRFDFLFNRHVHLFAKGDVLELAFRLVDLEGKSK